MAVCLRLTLLLCSAVAAAAERQGTTPPPRVPAGQSALDLCVLGDCSELANVDSGDAGSGASVAAKRETAEGSGAGQDSEPAPPTSEGDAEPEDTASAETPAAADAGVTSSAGTTAAEDEQEGLSETPGERLEEAEQPVKEGVDWRTDYCTCDLTVGTCDVDCCCDPSCDERDRSAFSACQRRPSQTPDERYCLQTDLIFANNTELQLTRTEAGLFCIVRDNLVSKNAHADVKPAASSAEFEALVSRVTRPRQFRWSPGPAAAPLPPQQQHYRSGDLVWIAYGEAQAKPWGLRWSGPVSRGVCSVSRPVRFLRDAETECWLRAEETGLDQLDAGGLAAGCVLSAPAAALQPEPVLCGDAAPEDPSQATTPQPTPAALPIRAYLCGGDTGCTEVSSIPGPRVVSGRVQQALLSADWVVRQRAGQVVSVRLDLVLGQVSLGAAVRQRISVSFLRPGDASTAARRSGNPGYVRGLPVLAGKAVTNTSAVPPRSYVKGSVGPIVLPSPGRGDGCSSDVGRWRPLAFGVDAVMACRLESSGGDCGALQRRIISTLLAGVPGNATDSLVAALGSARVEHVNDWVPVLGSLPPTLSPETTELGCRGLVTSAHWTAAWALTGAVWRPQPRLVSVRLAWGRPRDVTGDGAGRLSLTVTSSVTFAEVTPRAVPEFARPPRVDISLPADFFYPFTAGGAGTGRGGRALLTVGVSVTLIVAYFVAS